MSPNEIHEAPKAWGLPPIDMHSPLVEQGYGNTCAVRCQQLILQDFGIHVSEEELAEYAINKGWFTDGTPMIHVGNLLEDFGVPVCRVANGNIFTLTSELAQGHRVIVSVDADELWRDGAWEQFQDAFGPQPNHALIVAGIDTSNPEDIRVHLMDPGTGDIAKSYALDQFMDAWEDSGFHMVSTVEPAPPWAFGMDSFGYSDSLHIPDVAGIPYPEFERFHALAEQHLEEPAFIELMREGFSDLMNGESCLPELLGTLLGDDSVSPEDVPLPEKIEGELHALSDMGSEADFSNGSPAAQGWVEHYQELGHLHASWGDADGAQWYADQVSGMLNPSPDSLSQQDPHDFLDA